MRCNHRTKVKGPIVETVGAPTLEATHAPEEVAQEQAVTERETILVSQPLTLATTAATPVAAAGGKAETHVRSTRENAHKIMLMLEKTMEKVCEWSEQIKAERSATAERDVQVWKRQLVNCEEALKCKVAALTEAEKAKVSLRRAIEAKDAELAKVWAELEAERRARTNVEQLYGQLKDAQADVNSFKRRLGVLKGDAEEARQEA
jgi:chromosome segregation ATPase